MGPSQIESIQSPTSLEPQHDITNGGNSTALSQAPCEGVRQDLSKESPSMQVMECSTYDSHRIHSSVFERDQSSDPSQWSLASNESLFSIHIGSISKDHSLRCSDDIGKPEEASMDSPFRSTTIHSPFHQDYDLTCVNLGAMGRPIGTVKEGLRESEDQNHEKCSSEGRESNASVKSFAFPVLTGGLDKDSTGMLSSSANLIPHPAALPKQETKQSPQSDQKAPQGQQPVLQKKWFSCFPCWSCCL